MTEPSLTVAERLSQEAPPVLAFARHDGRLLYALSFDGPVVENPSGHYERPFTWEQGPPGGPSRGKLKITPNAASELLSMTIPAARWDRIFENLKTKYVNAGIVPDGGDLLVTYATLT